MTMVLFSSCRSKHYDFLMATTDKCSYFTIPVKVSASLKARNLTSFLNLIQKANLTTQLDTQTGITVFAPSNDAIAAYSNATYSSTSLQTLVKSHVVADFVGFLPLLTDGLTLTTLAGTKIKVTVKGGDVFINDAKIIFSNIVTENGVIQVIDKVSSAYVAITPVLISVGPCIATTPHVFQ
jgi:uncharacterized surface protein with fasciclin (FAS1) repeats